MKKTATALLMLLSLLLSGCILTGCASAGNHHITKEYYDNGHVKKVVVDENDVGAFMQKDVVGSIGTSTSDENGYKHTANGKNLNLQGDTEFMKGFIEGGIRAWQMYQTGGASTLLQPPPAQPSVQPPAQPGQPWGNVIQTPVQH